MTSFTTFADDQLVQLGAAGDNNALNELINRHKNKLYTSIYFLVKDKYLAEDIFQDTFIKAINTIKAGKYTGEGKFLAWVARIARNMCIDHFRIVKRKPTITTSDDRNILETLNFASRSDDEKIEKKESHDTVNQMLELLPLEQREVILLRHYADLSFKDIAALTNCSINTSLGRMRYGLMNLRKMMAEKNIAV
ncbi:MAG: sigma-70 family RNA polymerase sigma factor [Bacteroidota bacterium]|nr:sigma-70 family RNA polymerase sigma factor [Bacteroidota bacterium]